MDRANTPDPLPRAADVGGDGPSADLYPAAPATTRAEGRTADPLWWAAGVLYRKRWWLVATAVLMAALSVYLTLQIPNRYRAETRVLVPDNSGSFMASAISAVSPAAAALLGGGGAGYTRYLAILTSPSTLSSVVERFDLVTVYETGDEDYPQAEALRALTKRADFEVSLDYDYLSVSVLDEDPRRAAQMANFFVERLNERHIEFQASNAAEQRRFLQRRLDQANAELDSAQAALQELQERSGLVEPTAQAEAFFSSLGLAQGAVSTAEIEYQALRSEFGPENPTVQAAAAAAAAARREVGRLTGGGEAGMPVPVRGLPRVQRQYAQIRQSLEIQRAIIETIQPLYEQAALQEQREADAVQVLDVAQPPTRKAEPGRTVLVLLSIATGVFFVALFLVARAWWADRGPALVARLRGA